MKKICYVIGTLEVGGAEKQLYYLVKNLDKSKFTPVVIALRGGVLEFYFKRICKIKIVGKKWKIDPFFFLKLVFIIREEKTDILHTFMFTSNTWGRIGGFICKVPMIFSSERCVDVWKKWYHIIIDRILLSITKKIVVNSFSVRNFYMKLEKIPEEKIEVIYNGIDIKKFENIHISSKKKEELGLQKAQFIVGAGGRFTKQKGFIYLIESIPYILKVFPDSFFIIIGDGPLRKEFEEVVKKLNIGKNVIFTGYRKDILEIFSLCDIIVVPSLFEGMPNILLEGMALKKPVVGTDIPEIKELIINGKNGLLVPVKNSQYLAKSIIFLLRNPDLRKKMGEFGYDFIKENFSIEKMVKKYEDLYFKFLKS